MKFKRIAETFCQIKLFFMDINEQGDKKNAAGPKADEERLEDQGSILHNNRPEENKQEAYVKDDQQSDLSYGRNNSRESDSPQQQ